MEKKNIRKGWIKVVAEMDYEGNIEVSPKVERYAVKFASHVEQFTGHFDPNVFFQDGGPATEFLENYVPKRHRKDLNQGYTVCFLADPWIVGHWYGYDAHTIVENGELR